MFDIFSSFVKNGMSGKPFIHHLKYGPLHLIGNRQQILMVVKIKRKIKELR